MRATCPHCEGKLNVNPRHAGKIRSCARCGEDFRLPSRGETNYGEWTVWLLSLIVALVVFGFFSLMYHLTTAQH